MVKGLNDPILIPVAYYFISSLTGVQRVSILTNVIKAVADCDARISNITFDGYPANISMCTMLGADMSPESLDFNPSFPSPHDDLPIAVIVDPSHLEKLVRNTLGSKEIIYDSKQREIKWAYFVALEKCSREQDFIIVNKLSRKHIEWQQRKMKVRIAVETLSASVADSMEYLMKMGHEDFQGAEATIEFVRYFNNLFDIFNSRSLKSKVKFKNPLCQANNHEIFGYLDEVSEYIKGLKISVPIGSNHTTRKTIVSILNTRSKTAFRGFLINIKSLKQMYNDILVNQNSLMVFPTFMLSQDFVELFFGKIRSLGGFNDNPTSEQFMSAYRKLLCNSNILASSDANVREFKNINMSSFSNILKVTSRRPVFGESISDDRLNQAMDCFDDYLNDDIDFVSQQKAGDYLSDQMSTSSIAFIASLIEERILATNNSYCIACQMVFIENLKIENRLIVSNISRVPCMSTYIICKKSDEFIKLLDPTICEDKFDFNGVYLKIFQQLSFECLFPETDFTDHPDHKFHLIKVIVNEYIRIKITHMAKSLTLIAQGKSIRNKLHKWIHFSGQ